MTDRKNHKIGKRLYIVTFGCQMNFRDSEHVMGLLLEDGFSKAGSLEAADVVLVNTCSVRRHAEERAYNNILDLRDLKKRNPALIIGVIGCMAQLKKEKIFEDLPLVDFTCGPDDEEGLPELIREVMRERGYVARLGDMGSKIRESFPKYRDNPIKAYVPISRGCDNFCSYCIVPFVRGKERSRRPKAILREVKDLAGRAFKEITLLGQNVNSYRGYNGKADSFVRLLEDIDRIKGIERVRFITSHPKDATRHLFKAMRDLPKVCEHLHLPVQSGSDRILKLMKRGYTATKYLRLADEYRTFVPEGSITTDIIVGFPTESEDDFRRTESLMKRIEFDSAYVFKYSPRPPARASRLKDDVPAAVKSERNKRLLDLQSAVSTRRNGRLVGSGQEVLFEDIDRKSAIRLTGRTRTNKIVIAEGGRENIGRLSEVEIERVTCQTLFGKVTP